MKGHGVGDKGRKSLQAPHELSHAQPGLLLPLALADHCPFRKGDLKPESTRHMPVLPRCLCEPAGFYLRPLS